MPKKTSNKRTGRGIYGVTAVPPKDSDADMATQDIEPKIKSHDAAAREYATAFLPPEGTRLKVIDKHIASVDQSLGIGETYLMRGGIPRHIRDEDKDKQSVK